MRALLGGAGTGKLGAWPTTLKSVRPLRNPIYFSTPESEERLLAYIWPDQRRRLDNAEQAIRLARAFQPPVIAGEADLWTERRLAEPQAEGVLRILFHTITMQYFDEEAKHRVLAAVDKAGVEATADRPFGYLSFELNEVRTACELRLKLWPSAEDIHLANAHPHGSRVDWKL